MLHRPALGRQWRERRPLCGSLFYLLEDKKGKAHPYETDRDTHLPSIAKIRNNVDSCTSACPFPVCEI